MIMNNTASRPPTTNIDSRPSTFTIAATKEAFEALSGGLYSDRPKAILRELTTNALDAVGQDGSRVTVHFPGHLKPTLTVTDTGTGMTHNTVVSLYNSYFSSTKTTTNDQTGAFGLGSKSPLSLVDTFTVTTRTVDDDLGRVYLVALDDSGIPSVRHVVDIDAPVGTSVSLDVPPRRAEEFHAAWKALGPYFPADIHVVDLLPEWAPTFSWADIQRHSQSLPIRYGYIPERTYRQLKIVQGPVAYDLELNALGLDWEVASALSGDYGTTLAVEVAMGTVRPALSRESLSLDQPTLDVLRDYLTTLAKVIDREAATRRRLTGSNLPKLAKDEPSAYLQRYTTADYRTWVGQQKGRRHLTMSYFHRDGKFIREGGGRQWDTLRTSLVEEKPAYYLISPEKSLNSLRRRLREHMLVHGVNQLFVLHPPNNHQKAYDNVIDNQWRLRLSRVMPRLRELLRLPANTALPFTVYDKDDWPLQRATSTAGSRQPARVYASTSGNYYDRQQVKKLVDAGRRVILRSDYFSLPTKVQNELAADPTTFVLYSQLTNDRTKSHQRLVEQSAATTLALTSEYTSQLTATYSCRQANLAAIFRHSYTSYRVLEAFRRQNVRRDVWPSDVRLLVSLWESIPDELWKDETTSRLLKTIDVDQTRRIASRVDKKLEQRYPSLSYVTSSSPALVAYVLGTKLMKDHTDGSKGAPQ